jgi:hypothetical protein
VIGWCTFAVLQSRFDASKTLAKLVEDSSASFCCEDFKAACLIIATLFK